MWIDPNTLLTYTAHADIRNAFPNVSLPASIDESDIEALGLKPVVASAQPAFDFSTQKVLELAPALIGSNWTQQWQVVALTAAEMQAQAVAIYESTVAATQARLDTFAQSRGYDGILSACTYASSVVPKFSAEGAYCLAARDRTWGALLAMLAEVEAGTRPMPSGYAEIESELPALVWP